MLSNSQSNYPDSVDKMNFFSDVSLKNKRIFDEYNRLISEKQYDSANALLQDSDTIIHAYCAEYFNLIENRIEKLQEYLLSKVKKENPFIVSADKPTESKINTIWI